MLTNMTLNCLGFGMLTRGNSYVLIAFVDLYFQSQQIAQSLSSQILFGIGGKRSMCECVNQGTANCNYCVYGNDK